MTRRLELVTDIAAAMQRVYDVSLDVDAHMASTTGGERAVAGVTSGVIALGETVTWSARHFGVRWRMTSRILAEDRPRAFTDEQVSGPFAYWHHQHDFAEHDGGTRMTDLVEWAAPLGPLGRLVEWAVLARYMERLLQRRNAFIKEVCERGDERYGRR